MKSFKRNAVIIVVALFVCVAAYLNWSYSKNADTQVLNPGVSPDVVTQTPTPTAPNIDGDNNIIGENSNSNTEKSGLFFEGTVDQASYFAETRLNRQQARDAAVATLTTVNDSEGASQEILDTALEQITKIATLSQKEAELEALIKTKGFSDCVVFMSDDGVKVTVPSAQSGLTAVEVAKITDIVVSETEYTASQMNIYPIY